MTKLQLNKTGNLNHLLTTEGLKEDLIFKIFNFPVFLIADEFPIPIRDFLKDSIPKEMILKYRKYNNFFSGRILMSQALQKFYDNNISSIEKKIADNLNLRVTKRVHQLSASCNNDQCSHAKN